MVVVADAEAAAEIVAVTAGAIVRLVAVAAAAINLKKNIKISG